MRIAVLGASGFLGGAMARKLAAAGHEVIGVGRKPKAEWSIPPETYAAWEEADLSSPAGFFWLTKDFDRVYHFAASHGGRGWMEDADAVCALNARIDMNVLEACLKNEVGRLFYASSVCVYPPSNGALREGDEMRPVDPDGLYGWAKLYGEKACAAYQEKGLPITIARLDGVYGPSAAYDGGREKAIMALLRKAIIAAETGKPLEVWGGHQVRGYMPVDYAIDAIETLIDSFRPTPVNIAGTPARTLHEWAFRCAALAGVREVLCGAGPVGRPLRYIDTTLSQRLGIPTEDGVSGLTTTYAWLKDRLSFQQH